MRLPQIQTVLISALGLGLLASLGAPANGDFTFGPPVNLGATINSPYGDGTPVISADGLEMYLVSNRPGGYGRLDIWVARRASREDDWGPPVNAGPQLNSASDENCGSVSADGLTLYFESTRPGGWGRWDIYTATRPTREAPWEHVANLGPVGVVNRPSNEEIAVVSADGLELYWSSDRAGGFGYFDLWMSTRASVADPWRSPTNLGPAVNTHAFECMGFLSPDGLTLFFISTRPDGLGSYDTWMAIRSRKGDAWSGPISLGTTLNSSYCEWTSGMAPDGRSLYFDDSSYPRPGGVGDSDIWEASITPIVDFNGDGKVDLVDLQRLVTSWGDDDPTLDIGPYPWGDGIIDIQDLKVFVAEWEKANPSPEP